MLEKARLRGKGKVKKETEASCFLIDHI